MRWYILQGIQIMFCQECQERKEMNYFGECDECEIANDKKGERE